jgi:hypothetical protein
MLGVAKQGGVRKRIPGRCHSTPRGPGLQPEEPAPRMERSGMYISESGKKQEKVENTQRNLHVDHISFIMWARALEWGIGFFDSLSINANTARFIKSP